MHLVEGSILLPISFFIIFLMLFASVIFYKDTFQEGRLQRTLCQPTTSYAHAYPELNALAETFENPPTYHRKGLFFQTMESNRMLSAHGQSPFRFFSLPSELSWKRQRKAVWSSSANNLWHYEAINGFAAQWQGSTE